MSASRRSFIQKASLLPLLAFFTRGEALGSDFTQSQNGLVLKNGEGETYFIGQRKGKVEIKVRKEDEEPGMSLLIETIPSKDNIPVHKHLNEEEFIFIHQGKAEVMLGEEVYSLSPGDLVYVPKGVWHGLANNESEDVIMYFGYSPAGFEGYFREIGTKTFEQDLSLTGDDWVRINKKYGVIYQ